MRGYNASSPTAPPCAKKLTAESPSACPNAVEGEVGGSTSPVRHSATTHLFAVRSGIIYGGENMCGTCAPLKWFNIQACDCWCWSILHAMTLKIVFY